VLLNDEADKTLFRSLLNMRLPGWHSW